METLGRARRHAAAPVRPPKGDGRASDPGGGDVTRVAVVRTQVELTEEQMTRLRWLAARQHVSVAKLIRQSVDRLLQESEVPDRATLIERAIAAAGKFSS